MQYYSLLYPLSVNHYWRQNRKTNIVYVSLKAQEFRKFVWATYKTKYKPFDEDVAITNIILHPKMTKSGNQYKKVCDIDNPFKCILDSLKGIAYHDDAQVKCLGQIVYGEPKWGGGIEFVVSPWDSKQNQIILDNNQKVYDLCKT